MKDWQPKHLALLAAVLFVGTMGLLLPQADAGEPMSVTSWVRTPEAQAQHCGTGKDCYELCELMYTTPPRTVQTGYFACLTPQEAQQQ